MTAEPLAAALIENVPPFGLTSNGSRLFHEADILAALSRAMFDDLAERVVLHLLVLRDDLGQWSKQSADLITAIIAQNAALRVERDRYRDAFNTNCLVLRGTEERAERLEEAADYILDGMGIHAPDYEIDPDDDFLDAANSDWVRDVLMRLAAALKGADHE